MIEQNIKAISQLVGKPLADLNESDIQKIINSDQKDLLQDIPTLEYLMENTNDWFAEFAQPLYVQLMLARSMTDVENHLRAYDANPDEYRDELKIQMESKLETDNALDILAATYVLLSYFPEFEYGDRKENVCDALEMVESFVTRMPLPEGMAIVTALLTNLYFPVMSLYKEIHNEILVARSDAFREQLVLYAKLVYAAENYMLDEQEVKQNG